LNFTKLLKVVWIDLKELCKIYKRNKKTEKEKEEKKGKIEKGRRHRFGPVEEATRGPTKPRPNRYLSLSPRLTGGTPSSARGRLQPQTGDLAGDRFLHSNSSPLFNTLYCLP
jgi:hypothetical protein